MSGVLQYNHGKLFWKRELSLALSPAEGEHMDLLYLGLMLALAALSYGLIRLCERL
jgi:hypothetical protein